MSLSRIHNPLLALLLIPSLAHCYHGADPQFHLSAGLGEFEDDTTDGDTGDTTDAGDADDSAGNEGTDDGTSAATTGEAADDDADAIDAYILGLGHLGLPPEQPPMLIECDPADDACLEDTAQCIYTHYETTEHFAEFVAFSPNSAVLWPGSIVRGQDASHGLLTAITLPRAPLTFSLSLETLVASPVGHMAEPSLSAFREARNEILAAGVAGNTPAALSFELSQMFSEQQLSLAIDTDLSWPGGSSVSAMFNFNKESTSNKILVDFRQAYYTIDVDVPAAPSDLFAPEVTLDEVQKFMAVDSPPMYVQSMTLGRRALFSIETQRDVKEVNAAFEAAVKAVVDGTLIVENEHKQVLESLTMKVFVLGGANGVQAVTGFDGLMAYILEGSNYSAQSPGAPLAYTLAYLDNTGTKFAYTTDFAEAICTDEMRVRVHGQELVVHGNGEGTGKGEMKWKAHIAGPLGECVLIHQPDTRDTSDGEHIPINQSCDLVFPVDQPGGFTVHLFAEELGGGLFDSDKQSSNSFPFSYDPVQRTWSPNLPANSSLSATNDNLNVELKYTVDLDGQ